MSDIKAKWIAADWGTTHMRAWAIGEEDNVLAFRESNEGMKDLQQNEFEPVLLRLIEIIGQDMIVDMDVETLHFIVNILNQLNIDKLRNVTLFYTDFSVMLLLSITCFKGGERG